MGGHQTTGIGDIFQGDGAGVSFIRVEGVHAELCMGQALGSLQNRVARIITGRKPKHERVGAVSTHLWRQQWNRKGMSK